MSSVFLMTMSNIVAFCLGADFSLRPEPSSSASESLPSLGRVFDSDTITSPVSPPENGLGDRSRCDFLRAPGRSPGSSVLVEGWGKAYVLGECSRTFSCAPGRSPDSSMQVEDWGKAYVSLLVDGRGELSDSFLARFGKLGGVVSVGRSAAGDPAGELRSCDGLSVELVTGLAGFSVAEGSPSLLPDVVFLRFAGSSAEKNPLVYDP